MRYKLRVALLTLGTVAGVACGLHQLRHHRGGGCCAMRSDSCEHSGHAWRSHRAHGEEGTAPPASSGPEMPRDAPARTE